MPTAAVTLDTGTKLAVDRTWLAHERTMMAWVRTATSLISFGFTIYKFFQLELRGREAGADVLIGPREFALLMIGTGLVALALAFAQHRRSVRELTTMYGHIVPQSVAGWVGGLVAVMGIAAIVAVFLRQ
jgi:putative membrane protein